MKLKIDLDIAGIQRDNIHGWSDKDGVVLHETVSPDYRGLKGVIQISNYLDEKDFGIHSVSDLEAHIAHARGFGRAIFYHTDSSGGKGNGLINSRKIGIELISRVMIDYPDDDAAWKIWYYKRDAQLRAAGKLIAALARAHGDSGRLAPQEFMRNCSGPGAGITTHWEVTPAYGVPGGHVDCHPRHLGGYFPKLKVIAYSRFYYNLGYKF